MQRSKALEAAKEIWDDLSDRSGFGLECLESDDPDTHEEIMTRMANVILRKAGSVEQRDPSPEVDPWELLRELYHACRYLRTSANDGNEELMRKSSDALKQHDAERKSDGT